MIQAFVAGPFRAPTQWGIEKNVTEAETLSLALARTGIGFVCREMIERRRY